MPWKYHIDDCIINEIGNVGKITSGKLKRAVEERLNRKKDLSTDVYSRHLKELASNISSRQDVSYVVPPVLVKEEHGIGKKTYYSLSPVASARYRLRLPITKPEWKRDITYHLLFMYIKEYDISLLPEEDINKYTFNTEKQFDAFLSKINVRREDLKLLGNKIEKKDSDGHVIYRYTNLIEHNKNIRIGKAEYPIKNKCLYIYALPGISVKDLIKGNGNKTSLLPLEHIQLSNSEIEEIFSLLENERLITKVKSQALELLGEDTRYDIADNRLRQFVKDCWYELYSPIEFRMIFEWKNLRYAKEKTKHWYRRIRGQKEADALFTSYRKTLERLKASEKKLHDAAKKEAEKHIRNYDRLIPEKFKEICKTYDDIIAKYPLARMLLDLVIHNS